MKLRIVREAQGHGKLYADNMFHCFTKDTADAIKSGKYDVLVEYHPDFRQELPRILADSELWLYPAKPYGPVVDGVCVGTVRNGLGIVNGFVAISSLLDSLERAYDRGENIVLVIED